jgi:hypothetical protein
MRSETMYCSDRMPDHVRNDVQLYDRETDNMFQTVYCSDRMDDHVSQVMCYCLDIVAVIMSEITYTTWDIRADLMSETMSVNNWLTLSQYNFAVKTNSLKC